jgi:hypothetical protein
MVRNCSKATRQGIRRFRAGLVSASADVAGASEIGPSLAPT